MITIHASGGVMYPREFKGEAVGSSSQVVAASRRAISLTSW